MPKKIKTVEEHLQTIEYLLAGILLKRDVGVQQVAKIIGCDNSVITSMYPQNKPKKGKNGQGQEQQQS